MKEKINTIFKIIIIVAILIITGSIFYHYVIFLPKTEKGEIESQRKDIELQKVIPEEDKTEMLKREIEVFGEEIKEKPQNKNQESEFYKNSLFKSISLSRQMYQLMEGFAKDTIVILEERISDLNHLVGANKQMGLQDSYLNELTMADLNYVESIRDVFVSYEAIAKDRIRAHDDLVKGLNELEGSIDREGFLLLLSGVDIQSQWALDWVEEMEKHFNKYTKHIDSASKDYTNLLSDIPSDYTLPNYFTSPAQINLQQLKQIQALENIAKQLWQINFDLKYSF